MDIVKLKVKNLSTKDKKELIKIANESGHKKIDLNNLDKLLESYFRNFPDEFTAFRKRYKYSLYNQSIQENDSKHLDYEYVVESLTQDQKNRIIEYIRLTTKHLKDENGNDYADEPRIIEIADEYREAIEEIPVVNENKREWLEENKNNKYILILPTNKEDGDAAFFKNDDELILFALNNQALAPGLLKFHWKTLDPHLKVNQWIEKNYEFELTQKHNSKQTKKVKQPKLKM